MVPVSIDVQRLYEALPDEAAACFLVDRLWPRGVRKEMLAHVVWAKDAAPSAALRKWFHDGKDSAAHWMAFVQRYKAELTANPEGWRPIIEASATQRVVLLYGAHDTKHNHAVILRDYLMSQCHHG